MVWGTMHLSPSTDRQYIDFNRVFLCTVGTYEPVLGTSGAGTRYRVPRGELVGSYTYVRYLIHQCFII